MQTAAPEKIGLTSNSLTNTVMYLFMYFNNSYPPFSLLSYAVLK